MNKKVKKGYIFFIIMLMLSLISYPALTTGLEWKITIGGTADDTCFSVIQTADGGFALAGWTKSYGAGSADMWLVKTDASGQPEWNRTYGGLNADWVRVVIQTSDGGFALGGITESYGQGGEDFWLVKTDANGQHEWNSTFGGSSDDVIRCFIQSTDGSYFLLGGTSSFDLGSHNWWLVKANATGQHEWNKTFGGSSDDRGLWMVQTTDGGLALLGGSNSYGPGGADYWLIKTDFNGVPEWNYTYGGVYDDFGNVLTQTSDGGFALAGGTKSFGVVSYDFWLVKTDVNGQHEWNRTYGSSGSEGHCASVVQTADDGYALVGETSSWGAGGEDCWLVRADADGNHLWNKTFGGVVDEWATALIQTPGGDFALTGVTQSFGAGGKDAWLILTSDSEPPTTTTSTPFWTPLILTMTLSILIIQRRNSRKVDK